MGNRWSFAEYNKDVNGNVIPGIIDLDEDAGPVRRYPESHRLLREYGRSTGEVNGMGFYIFDRSRQLHTSRALTIM